MRTPREHSVNPPEPLRMRNVSAPSEPKFWGANATNSAAAVSQSQSSSQQSSQSLQQQSLQPQLSQPQLLHPQLLQPQLLQSEHTPLQQLQVVPQGPV